MYSLNSNNFYLLEENGSFNFNLAIINAMWVFLPCVAVAFISAVTTHYIKNSYTKRLINTMVNLPNKEKSTQTATLNNNKKSLIIKISILAVGVALLVIGAIFGGYNDVLTKAVQICTECIGLG
ncbi:MAG: hypothetical protein IKU82_02025 [Clostridia bacterium]|nr:hypothetical protein [Clostridia bacterium]